MTLPVVPTDPDEPERNSALDCDAIETGLTITSVTADSIHLQQLPQSTMDFCAVLLTGGGVKSILMFVFRLCGRPLSWNTHITSGETELRKEQLFPFIFKLLHFPPAVHGTAE